MGVGLVWVDPDARPDIVVALGRGEDLAPLLLPGGDVEEAPHPAGAGVVEHLRLALDQPGIVEVAVAVDQPHAAASSSSRRGKIGTGWAIGWPSFPPSISAVSFSAEAGVTGAIASASCRTAIASVPSTAAIRSGSLLRSAHGAWAST